MLVVGGSRAMAGAVRSLRPSEGDKAASGCAHAACPSRAAAASAGAVAGELVASDSPKGFSGRLLEIPGQEPSPENTAHIRRARYELQAVAKAVLAGDIPHKWSIGGCRSCLRYGLDRMEVRYDEKRRQSYLGGLQNCGSPHVCPVCGGRIADFRCRQIGAVLDAHRDDGGLAMMGSLTFSHHAWMPFADVTLEGDRYRGTMWRLRRAWESMRESREYKELMAWADYLGIVRALEVTFGYNGPHPHLHAVWCLGAHAGIDPEVVRAEFERRLRLCWRHALDRVGLSYDPGVNRKTGLPNPDRSCVVKDASLCADEYLTKFGHARSWDAEQEVSRRHSKNGRNGHLTPWDLLRCISGDRDDLRPDLAAEWFIEYAHATKGADSLYISRKLLEKYEVPSLTDAQILELPESSPALVALDEEQWGVIEPQKIELMEVADCGRADVVVAWLRARGVPVILPVRIDGGTGPPAPSEADKRRLAGLDGPAYVPTEFGESVREAVRLKLEGLRVPAVASDDPDLGKGWSTHSELMVKLLGDGWLDGGEEDAF